MKTKKHRLSAAARAFRDAVRDILAEEGCFEVELVPGVDWRQAYRRCFGAPLPTATA
jgi:hypothetical protein